MSYQIVWDYIPIGYAASAAKDENTVQVQFMGFSSTEDGQNFIKLLEGFPSQVLNLLALQCNVIIDPSQVDHMLVLVKKDRTATVYLNELQKKLLVRASRPIKTGEMVLKRDIVDIERMELNVNIPAECSVVFLFSIGWRKGLFYDFGPLDPNTNNQRSFDCFKLFAGLYSRVAFQERFSIIERGWEILFHAKLFPFAGLKFETIDKLLNYIKNQWDVSELSDAIISDVRQNLPDFLNRWSNHPVFIPHIQFLKCAADRFANDDYMSCINIMLPRIEGILRTYHINIGRTDKPRQDKLCESAVSSRITEEGCLLLPEKFKEYLEKIYFANFNNSSSPCDSEIELSRHSQAHGVAPSDAFTLIVAAIHFLVLQQLFFYFDPVTK